MPKAARKVRAFGGPCDGTLLTYGPKSYLLPYHTAGHFGSLIRSDVTYVRGFHPLTSNPAYIYEEIAKRV